MLGDLTKQILDQASDAVVSMDETGLVRYWNPLAEAMFGIPQAEACGRPVRELIVPERFREAHLAGLRRFLDEGVGPVLGQRIEMQALRADGSEFPVRMTIGAARDGARWVFTAFMQDMTLYEEGERERERLVEELRHALTGSERKFDAVVGSLLDPVTIRDREHRIVYANRAALAHLGIESWEQLQRTPPQDIMADYRVLDEDGRAISMEQIPSVRLLRGEAAEPLMIQTINRQSGVQRWNLLKAAPLLDDSGQVEATIMVIEDVTAQKREERQVALVSEASRVLASSLDYEQTLRNVAELAVPALADWCAVDLIDEDGERIPVAVAHFDPARLSVAEEIRKYEPARPNPEQGLGRVLATGEPLLVTEVPDESLVAAAADQRHLELLRTLGMRSVAIVPIRLQSRTLGAMTLVTAQSDRVLDSGDVELAAQIADRAAVAIENARLYSERSRVAHTLQRSLLPDELPDVVGYELASLYVPVAQSAEVGGDFYDVWEAAGSWLVTIGDVTGKGAEAAALTALVRHTLRATSEFVSSPAELLSRLDRVLKKQRARSICTALCLRLDEDEDEIVLAVGGHPLPYCISRDGAERVGRYGPLLGGFEDAQWQDLPVRLNPGSTLLLYTDGVTDAIGPGRERYGPTRLQETLEHCRDLPASGVIARLEATLGTFQVGAHADDTAALALYRCSPSTTVRRDASRARRPRARRAAVARSAAKLGRTG